MKKITVILIILALGISVQPFAQSKTAPAAVKAKPTETKPGEAGYMQIKMTDVLISSAQPKPATKPKPAAKPKAIAVPAPKPTPLLLPAVQKVREAARR